MVPALFPGEVMLLHRDDVDFEITDLRRERAHKKARSPFSAKEKGLFPAHRPVTNALAPTG